MNKIKVGIYKTSEEIDKSIDLIEKFKKVNKTDFRLSILIDYGTDDELGYYKYSTKIYINPRLCEYSQKCGVGNPDDESLQTTLIHEFSHFLDRKYKMLNKYFDRVLDVGSVHLNDYSKTNTEEELAELICLYLTNPFLLRHIDKDVYFWLGSYFKSPTPCNEKSFIQRWKNWNSSARMECWKKWGIKVVGEKVMCRKVLV